MSGISGATTKQRSTDEMLDEVAHDAKIAGDGERVHSGAMGKSSAKAWSDRHDEGGAAVAREGAVQGVEHGVEHAIEHGLNKLAERSAHDVAFGLGVKSGCWSQTLDAKTRSSIDADVNARVTPRPFHSQG